MRSERSAHGRLGRRHLALPALLVVLLLGILAGVALAARTDTGGPTTTPTTTTAPDTTTALDTTTVPVTTTEAGTTDAGTTSATTTTTVPATTDAETTAPATTTEPAATTSETTTGIDETATNAADPVDQTTTQGGATTPTTTDGTGTSTVPCADGTTCGNNAATQIAVVSQTCNASSNDSVLNVEVQNLAGAPVSNFTINNTTTCLNTVSITQVVKQFCVGCSIVVVPPPTIQSVYVTQVLGSSTSTGSTQGSAAPPAPVVREAYCMPQPVRRADGTMGMFVDLLAGQPSRDPRWAGAVPAPYVPGVGFACADGETSAADSVPVFTLTVPASFVGQYVNLCLQPPDPKLPTTCHRIRIDQGATISVPVSGHVTAVVKQVVVPAADRPKSRKQVAAAADAFHSAIAAKPSAKPAAKHAAHKSLHPKTKGKP